MRKQQNSSLFLVAALAVGLAILVIVGTANQRTQQTIYGMAGVPPETPFVLYFLPSTAEPQVGSTLTVDVMLTATQQVSGVQFDLAYPAKLGYPRVTEGTFFGVPGSGTTFFIPGATSTPGLVQNTAVAVLGATAVSGEGIVVTVQFDVFDSGTADLTFADVLLADANGISIPAASVTAIALPLTIIAGVEPPVCGNGICEPSENSTSCPLDCPPPPPICGNGVREGSEQCDDGNTLSGDGCSSACVVEVLCPMDVRTCPDGSTVGRVLPSCEFVPCPPAPIPPPLTLSPVQSSPAASTVTADIRISTPVQVSGVQFDLAYDPAKLGYRGVTEGTFFGVPGSGTTFFIPGATSTPGLVQNTAVVALGAAPTSCQGTVATIEFDVLGSGSTQLQLSNALVADTSNQQLSTVLGVGTITLGDPSPVFEPPSLCPILVPTPNNYEVYIGDTLIVSTEIFSLDTSLFAYRFDMNFDAAVLRHISTTTGTYLPEPGVRSSFAVNDDPATVNVIENIAGAILSGPAPSGSGTLSVSTFQVISPGARYLRLSNTELLDGSGRKLSHEKGYAYVHSYLRPSGNQTNQSNATCGNGICEIGETASACPADCSVLWPAIISILSPANGSNVSNRTVPIRYSVTGSYDHVHLQMYGYPEVRDFDVDGDKTYIFEEVALGSHVVRAYPADALHNLVGEDAEIWFTVIPRCGDDVREWAEVCDGNDQSCTINSYTGTQACRADCSGFNACTTTQRCGDGIINGPELCDRNTQACTTSSGLTGSQRCNEQCTAYSECAAAVPASCTDSDGGLQYFTLGSVTGVNAQGAYAHTDYCSSAVALYEYYCKGTSFATTKYNCATGCASGKCNPKRDEPTQTSCMDSDGGKKYYAPGFAYLAVDPTQKVYDSCTTVAGVGTVTEQYCKDGSIQSTSYRCPYGCVTGACKKPQSLLDRFRAFLFGN